MAASKNLELALKINADTKDAQNNVQRFGQEFGSLLNSLGKTGKEANEFYKLAVAIDKGEQSVEDLDAATRKLVDGFRAGREVAQARDFLGLEKFANVEKEIQKVRGAYDTLAKSGSLSHGELAQAALRTEERINKLKDSTNGWMASLQSAKGAFVEAAAAGAGLGAVVHQAVQFESAMADVAKTTGMSDEQIGKLGGRLKELATELPISADGLAKIAAAGGSLGVANDRIEEFVRLAATMATAFDLPVEQAGEAVAALTNNFGLSIAEVRKLGDTINVLGNQTAAREKDIVDVLTRIGGTAKQFGLTAEQAAGLADAMLALKMPTEVAGTAINSMLGKLQAARVGSKEFQEGLAQLGMSADEMAARVAANPQQALNDLLRTLAALDAQSRAEILTQMFGAEHQDEIGRLVGALGNYDTAMRIAGQSAQNTGAMQQEFETRLKTTEAQLGLLKNSVENAAISLGTVFLPIVRQTADGLATGADAIANFAEAFPTISGFGVTLATVAASVGALRLGLLALGTVGGKALDGLIVAAPKLTLELNAATAAMGKLNVATALAGSAILGWEIGSWARKNFEFFRVAGVSAVEQVMGAVEHLRYSWESLEALVTSDTLSAATARHQARAAENAKIFRDMYADARKGADEAGTAAQGAADKTQALGEAGQDAGAKIKAGQEQAKEATESFDAALAKSATTAGKGAKSFQELVEQYDLLNPANADKLTLAIAGMGSTSESAARIVKEQLVKAYGDLSGPELQASLEGIRKRIAEQAVGAETLSVALDAGVRAQFIKLGIDADQALTGVSAKVRDGISALDSLGQAGVLNGQMARQGLTKLLDEAKTTAEVRAVITEIDRLKDAGILTGKTLVDAYDEAFAAQRKIGTGGTEVQAALDRANASAAAVAAAFDVANGKFREGTDAEALLAEASRDARDALIAVGGAATNTSSDLSNLAAQTRNAAGELTGAAARAAENKKALDEFKSGFEPIPAAAQQAGNAAQSFYSPWADLYAQLGQFSKEFVDQMHRIGESRVGVIDFSTDLAWGYEKLKELTAGKAEVDELAAALQQAASGGEGLSEAIARANIDLSDGADIAAQVRARFYRLGSNPELFQPLIDSLEAARAKLQALREEAASTLRSFQDELDQLEGNRRAIEERDFEAKRAKIQADLEYSQQIGDAELQTKYRDQLAILEKIHKVKLDQFRKEEEAAKRAQPPAPEPRPVSAPAPATRRNPRGDSMEDRLAAAIKRGDEAEAALIQDEILARDGGGQRPTANRRAEDDIRRTEEAFRRESESRGQPAETIRLELALPNGRVIPVTADRRDALSLRELQRQGRSQ